MATKSGKAGAAGRRLEVLWTAGTLTGLSDAQLLNRYVDARGRDGVAEAAFRELVARHGPMVMGVCRQILRHHHDVDDAFQSTFLVLVRKADSIRVDESLAPWLCSVAHRTARRARDTAARYRPIDAMPIEEPSGPPPDDAYSLDLRPLLHEELDRLPVKFREAIVLCHLEGLSHEEAAQLLRWPVGTVSSRLSRGRRLLRSRLERRGLAISPAMLSANWLAGTPTTVASALVEYAVAAAIGSAATRAVPALVLSLTQGVLRTMWLGKLRTIALTLLIGATSGSLGVWAHWPSSASRRSLPDNGSASTVAAVASISTAGDAGSVPQTGEPSPPPRTGGVDVRLTDCPAGTDGGLPAYCPISMAANALSRIVGQFHGSSEASR